MRKNIFWAMCFLFLWTKTLFAGFLIGRSIGTYPDTVNSRSVLQSGTTGAFTIAITSTGATAATYAVYTTSARIIVSQLPMATTTWFIGLQKSTYTLAEFVNNINATMGTGTLSATFVNGCYKLQVSSPQVQAEGTTNGLFTKAGGAMEYDILLSSIVPVTVYLNATQYQSRYFPARGGVYNVVQTAVSLASGTTMYIYEGNTSTTTTTLLAIPVNGVNEKTYSDFAPVKSTNWYSLEYRIMTSTWVNMNDFMQIFYFTK